MSADAEMGIIQQSIDYKLNALKETWVGTAQTIVDRGSLGTIIDGLTKISEVLGLVVDKAGLIGTIGLGAGLFTGIQNVGRSKNALTSCSKNANSNVRSLGYQSFALLSMRYIEINEA